MLVLVLEMFFKYFTEGVTLVVNTLKLGNRDMLCQKNGSGLSKLMHMLTQGNQAHIWGGNKRAWRVLELFFMCAFELCVMHALVLMDACLNACCRRASGCFLTEKFFGIIS